MTNILIVDDNTSIKRILSEILASRNYFTEGVSSGKECLEIINQKNFDLILLDIKMQGMDGIEVLAELMKMKVDIPIIMMSAHGHGGTARKVILGGAFNYIQKPFDQNLLLEMIAEALEDEGGQAVIPVASPKKKKSGITTIAGRKKRNSGQKMIGSSPALMEMKKQLELVAPTNLNVLIAGPNGAGKEMVARAIHDLSPRRKERFVEVNCAAIPGELIESTFFGHKKGAFTGADKEGIGLFEEASAGTIFLDEIGDLAYSAQTKLLRVLQEETFTKVGGNKEIVTNARVIAATNQNLDKMMADKTFRIDLFYRLEEYKLMVPSLNDRKTDIPELVDYFIHKISVRLNRMAPRIEKEAVNILAQQNYPGNIRQLQNIIKKLLVNNPGELITVDNVNSQLPKIIGRQGRIIENL